MLALYAFSVFGYVTAALASFFVGRDVGVDEEAAQKIAPLQELQAEIAALRTEIQHLTRHMGR
jgi:voltage-gated potassium channel